MLNNKLVTVKNKDIQTVKFQYYTKSKYFEIYDETNNSWNNCKMIKVHKDKYELSIEDHDEVIILPLNTMKLRECICLKCLINKP